VKVSTSNAAFAIFAVLIVAGLLAIWWPLALLAGGGVALVVSVATARTGDR
jgi:hypothetical protein